MSRGRFSLITLVLLLALVWSIRTHSQSSNPAPTFVGSQACATCHTADPHRLERRPPQQDDSAGDRRPASSATSRKTA